MTRNDALRKLQAIMALKESPNPKEAAAAMATARKLMIKFKIEEGEIAPQQVGLGTTDIPFLSRKQTWETILADTIARHFNCTCTYADARRIFTYYGEALDRTVAEHAFVSSRNRFLELVEIAKVHRKSYENPKAFRTSWLLGAAIAVQEKLRGEAKVQDEESPEVFAIVSQAKTQARNFMLEVAPNLRNVSVDTSFAVTSGFLDGVETGRNFEIAKGLR